MPIYEFYCSECNTLFNFFSRRINTTKQPLCPKCNQTLQRQMSTFATIGKATESSDDFPLDIDESQMEKVLAGLAGEAGNINEDDPRQMANLMRKFSDQTGLSLGDGMEEALARMEAGEDPDKIEQEMGDILENEDPFGKKTKKSTKRSRPLIDETLYEL
ncbi:MAG: zinc ribbon domain-containing protein [Desulfobulbaceae bacterium]|uniref:Zinc ribbon domain-containing protein n=1 Tax=Candidatus Desulfobia pelagia TaxID=2841692 RepID=A0A8J6ND02_9BACT|nr:zinc ribbon domain-containing protein [Candidatus Desulfobia pelagia]